MSNDLTKSVCSSGEYELGRSPCTPPALSYSRAFPTQNELSDATICGEVQCISKFAGYDYMQELMLADHSLLAGLHGEQLCTDELDNVGAPRIWNHSAEAHVGRGISSETISTEFGKGISTSSTEQRTVPEISGDDDQVGGVTQRGLAESSQSRISKQRSNILITATDRCFWEGEITPGLCEPQATSNDNAVQFDREYQGKESTVPNSSFVLSETQYDGTTQPSKKFHGFPGPYMEDVHAILFGTISKSIGKSKIHDSELHSRAESLQAEESSISDSHIKGLGSSCSPSFPNESSQLCFDSCENFSHASGWKRCRSPSSTGTVKYIWECPERHGNKSRVLEGKLLLDTLEQKHLKCCSENSTQSNIIGQGDEKIMSETPEIPGVKNRSLVEKRRRNRISNELEKLRNLIPSPLAQGTNTARLLNVSIEYIMLLEKRVFELEDILSLEEFS